MPPPPFSLAVTPSMMLSDYYQTSFAQECFLRTFDNISPYTTATVKKLKCRCVPEYTNLLRLTNWLLFAEHQLHSHPNILHMDGSGISVKEYKCYIRSIVEQIQQIVLKHCNQNDPGYDTSYATRHEMFITSLLQAHAKSPNTQRLGNHNNTVRVRNSVNGHKSRRVIKRKLPTKLKVRSTMPTSSILRSKI